MAELKLLLLVACCLLRGACSCRVTGAQQAPAVLAVLAVWIVRLFQGVVFGGEGGGHCCLLGPLGWDGEVRSSADHAVTNWAEQTVASHGR